MSAARTKEAVRVTSFGKPKLTNTLGKGSSAATVEARAMKTRAGAGSTPLDLSMSLSRLPSRGAAAPSGPAAIPGRATLVMHQGIDFAAELGTAVHAAADGVVTGAAPNGGYANWIQIEREEEFSTFYGHLSSFAPGIAPRVRVQKGDLIGFVGNTGRSTGTHLRLELWSNGKPTNPVNQCRLDPPHLSGRDLECFREVVGAQPRRSVAKGSRNSHL